VAFFLGSFKIFKTSVIFFLTIYSLLKYIMVLGTWRQESDEFENSLGYIVRPTIKKPRSGGGAQW
jgi:hypothetical protein